jgi:hypothetical protein
MRIFKYPLEVTYKQTILMPEGAKILSFQAQDNRPCLWAMVDPNAFPRERIFFIYGTGHDVYETNLTFIGTTQLGMFVWHLFEKTT